MNQPLWMPKRRIEVAFRRALLDMAKGIVSRVGETSDPQLIVATLEHIARTPDFTRPSEQYPFKMIKGLFNGTARQRRGRGRNDDRGCGNYKHLKTSF